VLLGVAQVFTRMGIQRRWRAWLTNAVISRWLANGRYYQLNLVGGDHQNPEYRIAEDLRVATDSPGAPPPSPYGTYGRWRYVPSLDAFIVVTAVSGNVHFFKPASQ